MTIVEINNQKNVFVLDDARMIKNERDVLDLMGEMSYYRCSGVVLFESSLPTDFFDLSSRIAGEILQKFVNYRKKVAIVGDFSKYPSQSLKDFIYESNKGSQVFFVGTQKEAIQKF